MNNYSKKQIESVLIFNSFDLFKFLDFLRFSCIYKIYKFFVSNFFLKFIILSIERVEDGGLFLSQYYCYNIFTLHLLEDNQKQRFS